MISRRDALKGLAIVAGGTLAKSAAAYHNHPENANTRFSYCLNTSTISGQKVGFMKEFEIASKAGYNGIEIWVRDLEKYIQEGGKPEDVKKHAGNLGLTIENAIGFAQWIIDDETGRKAGMEQMKREMELLVRTGCKRVAAPPAGATALPLLNLDKVAERYRKVLELGENTGIVPQLEIWGPSANLHHIAQAMYVASAAGHPKACILPDVYHMFRGGSNYHSLKLLSGAAVEMFHFNDFPSAIPREKLTDSDRVYPGDGAAPFNIIMPYLKNNDSPVVLSLEVFNKSYWEKDALEVAKTGLVKMKQAAGEI